MVQQFWVGEDRKVTVCVDSYDNGIPRGWFYHTFREAESFESLSQFLVKMDVLLEELRCPQAYNTHRTFATLLHPQGRTDTSPLMRKGRKATFELQILFRHHSSWQGVIVWKDKNTQQYFRSVLELIFLLDSALRGLEDSAAS